MMLKAALPERWTFTGSGLDILGITWFQFQHALLFTLFSLCEPIDTFQKAGMSFEACTTVVSALKTPNCALSFLK